MNALLLSALAACPGLIEFQSLGPVTVDGIPIDVGSYAAPLMADWDGDGLEDLLAGQFDEGRIRFYKNLGTPQSPLFSGFEFLMDGGEFLSVPSG